MLLFCLCFFIGYDDQMGFNSHGKILLLDEKKKKLRDSKEYYNRRLTEDGKCKLPERETAVEDLNKSLVDSKANEQNLKKILNRKRNLSNGNELQNKVLGLNSHLLLQ